MVTRAMALALFVVGLGGCSLWGDDDDDECGEGAPVPQAVPTTIAQTASSLNVTVSTSSDGYDENVSGGITLTLDSDTLYADPAHCPSFQASATLNGSPLQVASQGGPQCVSECCASEAYSCERLSFSSDDFSPFANPEGLDFVITDASGSREIRLLPSQATIALQGSNVISPGNLVTFAVSSSLKSVVQVVVQSADGSQYDDVTSTVAAQDTSFNFTMPVLGGSDAYAQDDTPTCAQSPCPEIISGSVLAQSSGTFPKCDFASCASQLATSFSIPIFLDINPDPEADAGAAIPDSGVSTFDAGDGG
jgi:hypothetical protein